MIRPLVIVALLVGMTFGGREASGQHPGFGQGNWGGSSFTVGRSTFYANGEFIGRWSGTGGGWL